MSKVKDITEKLEDAQVLHFLTSTFTEITALKIKSIRQAYERNPEFFRDMNRLYDAVKQIGLAQSQKDRQVPSIQERPSLHVAVTSNHRFFGDLNTHVMKEFIEKTAGISGERLVIGLTGTEYIRPENGKCFFMNFDDDVPRPEEVRVLLGTMFGRYERIFVYYPKFRTMFAQSVGILDITHTPDEGAEQKNSVLASIEPIFEPELSEILSFFETQIRYILFMRVMLETELSRLAARLISMSNSEERAKEQIRVTKQQLAKAMLVVGNIQLLEIFAGRTKWNNNQ